MSKEIELLIEIRDLLQVMAEPALAKRDEKLRDALRDIAGNGRKSAAAVTLMDGSRTQSTIAKEAQIDKGQLSRLVRALAKASLVTADERHPKLALSVPHNFFGELKE